MSVRNKNMSRVLLTFTLPFGKLFVKGNFCRQIVQGSAPNRLLISILT